MKKLNIGMLAEGIAFTLLSVILFLLPMTGAYMYYVTPRTVPYLYFAGAVLLLLGAYALCRLFERTHIKQYSHLTVLLIPALFIAWSVSDAGILPRLAQSAASKELPAPSAPRGQTYIMKASAYEGIVLNGYDGENKRLIIPQEETYHWLVEIFESPEPFLGFTITTMGQVMKDPEYFEEGCFSPVRQLMSCCAADLYPVGFTCEYEDADRLETDAWVSVTGKLMLRNFEEYSELRIAAEDVAACPPAWEPYLFAY